MVKVGIVGLPNVGKSTLFNALTKMSVPAENYPFCTIDPSVGVVGVPDERLQKLSVLSQSAKTIPAAIEFVDIAGLVAGRDWRETDSWFCSELIAAALVACGWFPTPLAADFAKITPRDMLLIVSGRVNLTPKGP